MNSDSFFVLCRFHFAAQAPECKWSFIRRFPVPHPSCGVQGTQNCELTIQIQIGKLTTDIDDVSHIKVIQFLPECLTVEQHTH
jgi:hypothetical protein